ncbi:HlyD family efflux transporter periplasmic adaptor subunit [Bacillus wiedmannii]|uniref:HlyD family efflux transporter periplasmic adaptor subunit n=1 Tax=Bacillus wiedmannii TaxID=1890302 RepID=UPI000BF0E4D3|nr:HlyD family efflux transporter periplasmic adaptor subunit [Bacillus wiedmannii]PEL85036.1 hemolysin D [Bacillus wiedmannii]
MSQPIRDIIELTDSVEMLEKNPPKFIKLFIYLVLAILVSALIWAYFSKIDISTKGSATIQSSTDTVAVKSKVSGEINDIKIKQGEKVHRGDPLIGITNKQLEQEKKHLEENRDKLDAELKSLNILKDVIEKNQSKLPVGVEGSIKNELDSYLKQKDLLKNENKNKIADFNFRLQGLNHGKDEVINNLEFEIEAIKNQNDILKIEKEGLLKQNKIIENENINQEAEVNMNKVNQLDSQIEGNLKSILIKQEQIKNRTQEIALEKKVINENIRTQESNIQDSVESLRTSKVSDISKEIDEKKKQLSLLQQDINNINLSYEQTVITAPKDGVIEMPNLIKIGDIIEQDKEVLSISPDENTNRVLLYINSEEINKIKTGDKIKYTFEVGTTETYYGSVVQIYHDPVINKNKDTTFFVVEGTIENTGKKKLRSGSTGKAAIVVDQKNILSLILEKLDVLN